MDTSGIPTVVDYKSGNPGDDDAATSSLQLKIYAKVAMEHYRVNEINAELHWLQTAESSRVSWISADMEKLDYRLYRTFEDVEACQLPPELAEKLPPMDSTQEVPHQNPYPDAGDPPPEAWEDESYP